MDAQGDVHSSADHRREMQLTGPDIVETMSLRLLDRHEQRRAAGLPTISTIVGEPTASVEIARRWAERRGRSLLVVYDSDTGTFAASWLDGLSRLRDLRQDAASWLARHLDRAGEDVGALVARKSQHELETLLETVPAATGAMAACRQLLTGDAASSVTVAGVWELVPPAERPALVLRFGEDARPRGRIERAARLLTDLAIAQTGLTLIAAVRPDQFDDYELDAAASRAKTLFCTSVIRLPDVEARAAGLATEMLGPDRQTSAGLPVARVDDEARSLAERMLFDRLEALPETAGLFRLNATPGLRFGPARDMEVDLLAGSLRVAVEVDGFHHFRDEDAYRRDRRKDLELQTHGYLVVRVLADDVFHRLDDVLMMILTAVASRRGRDPGV